MTAKPGLAREMLREMDRIVVAREFGEADDVLVLDRLGDRLAQAHGKVLEIERAKHRRLHAIEAFSSGRACPRRRAAQD